MFATTASNMLDDIRRGCEIMLRSVVVLQCILLVYDVEKSAVDNISWQVIAD